MFRMVITSLFLILIMASLMPDSVEGRVRSRARSRARSRTRARTRARAVHMASHAARSRVRHRRNHHSPSTTASGGRVIDTAICVDPVFDSLDPDMCNCVKVPKTDLVQAHDISCGMWETIEDLASACHHDTNCDAFTTMDGKPWCMKEIHDSTSELVRHNHDLYYVRKTATRLTFTDHNAGSGGVIFFLFLIAVLRSMC